MSYPSILNRLPEIAFALIPRANFPDDIRARHFAFLLDKSKILNIGWNSYKSHPEIQRRHYPKFTKGLHSETNCLLYSRRASYKGLMLAVLRINWNGELDYSHPCPSCLNMIRDVGIKDVWFTTKTGGWNSIRNQTEDSFLLT